MMKASLDGHDYTCPDMSFVEVDGVNMIRIDEGEMKGTMFHLSNITFQDDDQVTFDLETVGDVDKDALTPIIGQYITVAICNSINQNILQQSTEIKELQDPT